MNNICMDGFVEYMASNLCQEVKVLCLFGNVSSIQVFCVVHLTKVRGTQNIELLAR